MSRTLNILFTCAGRRVALLDAFRDAMDALGVTGRVLAADATWASPAYHLADEGLVCPLVRDEGYWSWLAETIRRKEIGLLVPVTDLDLPGLAERREELAEAGCRVITSTPEAVRICRDKALTAGCVQRAGLQAIETQTLTAFLRQPFFPCFAKPRSGSASIGAARIERRGELDRHVERFGADLVIQPDVGGREYTIDVYRSRDMRVRCVVPRQRLAVRSGEVEKGVTVNDPELIDDTVKLAEQIDGLCGVFCCQCRRPAGGRPHFFEINPRFGGGAPLSIAAGANLPRYVLEEVLGLEISATMGEFTDRLVMLRYDRAVYRTADNPRDLPGFDRPSFL